MNLESRYIYISNIPKAYHAYHLRNFFSQYVESSAFVCFHFRHRPQLLSSSEAFIGSSALIASLKAKSRDKSAHCGFLSMLKGPTLDRFLEQYDRTHWLSPDDDEFPLADQCILTQITFDQESDCHALLQLIEFKPPSNMPQGNVGTPTRHFFKQIQTCQLDSSLITKLKLNFSQVGVQRKYGAVPYSYNTQSPKWSGDDDDENTMAPAILSGDLRSRTGVRIVRDAEYAEYVESKVDSIKMSPVKPSQEEEDDDVAGAHSGCEDEHVPNVDMDEPGEEWDRFEALHDDPYKVTRHDKANLKYEDKVELVWEKGSSGLVFHTDERSWRKLDPLRKEEPLFDEPASFDWDVNMEPYENPTTEFSVGPTPTGHWGSARDTSDLIDIQRSREGIDLPKLGSDSVEVFHQQTCGKGYGMCLMRRMGWKPGTKLGARDTGSRSSSSTRGLLYPLEADDLHGLAPRIRTGLGYYGPPRVSPYTYCNPSHMNTVYIRSVFDSPETVAQRSGLGLSKSLLRRDDPFLVLKYRGTAAVEDASDQLASTSASASASSFVPRNRTVILSSYNSLSKEGISFVPGGLLRPKPVSDSR